MWETRRGTFFGEPQNGGTRRQATVASGSVGIDWRGDICVNVEAFESPFVVGGEDARVYAFVALPVVEEEDARLCMRS